MTSPQLYGTPPGAAPPSPVTSLADLLSQTTSGDRTFIGVYGNNMGHPTLSITLPVAEAIERTTVYNDPNSDERAQRELNEPHAHGLAQFWAHAAVTAALKEPGVAGTSTEAALRTLKGAMGPQLAFASSPWTANVRGVNPNNLSTLKADRVAGGTHGTPLVLEVAFPKDLWSLLDAQHRRAGGDRAGKFMRFVTSWGTYPTPKSGIKAYFGLKGVLSPEERLAWAAALSAFEKMTVNIELHLGLDVEGERQVFADLNNKARKVDTNLSFEFDTANPILNFIQNRLQPLMDQGLSRSDLVGVNAIAFLNKTNVTGAIPLVVAKREDTVKSMWDAIESIEGFGMSDETVVTQVVVQKAIAKLVYDFAFAKTKTDEERSANDDHLQTLLTNLDDVDFRHSNHLWRYFTIEPLGRTAAQFAGIENYLSRNEDGGVAEKDLGVFSKETGRFTFSVKHNDVYPVIADLIRFKLGLPPKER